MVKRGNEKLIPLLCLCGATAIFSSTLSKTPALPLFASHLGASDAQVGWIAAASTIPGILAAYPAGALSDRYGWKKILPYSLFVFATAPLLYIFVQTPLQLAAARFYHGFATAVFGPVAMSAIAALSGNRKGGLLSVYSSSTLAGRAAAPFLGGFLLALWSFPGVFAACALTGAAALLIGAGLAGKAGENDGRPAGPGPEGVGSEHIHRSLLRLLTKKGLMPVGFLEAAIFFSYGAFEIMFPLYSRKQGLEDWQTGVIMGVQLLSVIILKPIFGRLSDRAGRMPLILSGLAIGALSACGITFWNSIYGFGLLNMAFGLGFALVTSSTRPLATELAGKGELGSSLGALSTLMDIGQVAGPPAVGLISSIYGYKAGFLTMAALLTTASVVGLSLIKIKTPPFGRHGLPAK